jgi:mannose-6-phosphate isomerase-like protein (cupin superfamily)
LHEVIYIRGLSITFLLSRHETDGACDAFELTVPAQRYLFVPHRHRDFDETILGVDGIVTWTVDGKTIKIGPGDQLFIPRGVLHGYANHQPFPARMLSIFTPGLVGPEFFRDMADVLNLEGPPNIAEISKVMNRYGVIPGTL